MAEREAPNHPSSTQAINFTYTAASGEQIIFKDPGRLCDQPGYRERDYSKAMGYGGGDGGGGGMGGGGGGCGGDGGC